MGQGFGKTSITIIARIESPTGVETEKALIKNGSISNLKPHKVLQRIKCHQYLIRNIHQ